MTKRRTLRALLALLACAALLAAGWTVSRALVPTPVVAVIRLEGDIWGDYPATISRVLEEAGRDPAVRAVVLDISSPGGEVTASEGLYYDVLRLRDGKPVLASVDEMAASGAYYVASATELIYSKPASMIGNIGVISYLPDPDLIDSWLITTGPFKLSGGSQVEATRQMEMMKQTFLAAIQAQRADRLQVGDETLSRGEIYLGLQAQRMGLIDEIGSQADAVSAAARLAGLRHYRVVDRTPAVEAPEELDAVGLLQVPATAASLASLPDGLPPGFYLRYVEPAP